jgi:quercetin dioxygenase-like cupin family protein
MSSNVMNTIVPWMARAALVAGALAVYGSNAHAGECPADKVAANAMAPGATAPVGVTDQVIGSIDLARKAAAFEGEKFRMRRLVVEPGGIVPWHSHGVRPAIIYVVKGAITEYRSTCAVPIEHKAGEVTSEFGADLAHWWKNNTREPAVLLSADILDDASNDKHMM